MFLSFIVTVFTFFPIAALAQTQLSDIREEYIEANVPRTRAEFDSIMNRDLLSYFRSKNTNISSVSFSLLRDGPTQSGAASPKFYAWVELRGSGNRIIEAGAVRVASIEKRKIQVTDFISRAEIKKSPSTVENIFPASLCEKIRKEAQRSSN